MTKGTIPSNAPWKSGSWKQVKRHNDRVAAKQKKIDELVGELNACVQTNRDRDAVLVRRRLAKARYQLSLMQ